MFPDIAFCCEWFPEDAAFYRYHPSQSTAIARSEQEQSDQQIIATLYLTKGDFGEFFLETKTSTIEPMTPAEARRWILAPEVKLLTLLYPELPREETARAAEASTQTSGKPIVGSDYEKHPDDIPF